MAQTDSNETLDLHSQLEEISVSVMLLEPSDSEQRAQLRAQLTGFEAKLGSAFSPTAGPILASMGQLLAKEAAEAGHLLDALQQSLQDLGRIIAGSQGGPPGGQAGQTFDLPAWVDEGLFGDFISGQRLAQEDLEAIILRIERGETEAEDEEADLRRRLHSLKGDSATVGMEGLSQVYHELESLIEVVQAPVDLVEPYLKTLDWISAALESYSHMRHPAISPEEALSALKAYGETAAAPAPRPKAAPAAAPVAAAPVLSDTDPTPLSDGGDPIPMDWDEETIELVAEFLMEADEGIDSADRILLESQQAVLSGEQVNALFRIFHTIKGVAGFLNLEMIGLLAHATESLLNRARDGELKLVGLPLNLVFEATNGMRELLSGVREAAETMGDLPSQGAYDGLCHRLINLPVEGEAAPASASAPAPKKAAPPPAPKAPAASAPVPAKAPAPPAAAAAAAAPAKASAPAPAKAKAKPKASAPTMTELDSTSASGSPARSKGKGEGGERAPVQLREVVKVDLERVDALVDLIGELVILESMVTNSLRLEKLKGRSVLSLMGQLNKTVRDLQSLGLALRMVPLRGAFQKMARLIRDVSLKSHKSARLVVAGEKTEMDRRLVEAISDPLVHMVRNSVDHGLETPEERRSLGKPEQGTISLSAAHDGGNIVIEIADDGKGLNRAAILAKAEQKGLIPVGATLPDDEVWQLIFSPGFSTAAQVTEISGRGVGMDVVKRNIESLRGRITIDSRPGEGTTFKLHLPLTLAIISGLLFAVGEERYILPTLSVVESFQPTPDLISSYGDGTELVNVRGEILPLVRLHEMLGAVSPVSKVEDGLLVIVQGTRSRGAMLVDDILGQQNIVIKNLGAESSKANTFSGAAILSDGRVGLILNVDEVLQANGRERRAPEFSATRLDPRGLPQAQA